MSTVRIVAVVSAVAVATLAPTRSHAQLGGAVVITPYVGVYMPSSDVARTSLTSGAIGTVKHQAAVATGATASYWLNDRAGIETGLLYTSSDAKVSGFAGANGFPASGTASPHANLWLGSAKLMLQMFPKESQFNLRFGFGPAVITRNGTAYTNFAEGKTTGRTDVGAALSLCTRLNLTNKIGLRVRAEDYMYQTQLGFESGLNAADNIKFDTKMQNDFVLSAGLQFFLNR